MNKTSPVLAMFFEPDGYDMKSKKLMGRQSAGHAFLRSVVNDLDTETESLLACTNSPQSAANFQRIVNDIKPGITTHHCKRNNGSLLRAASTFYLPDPNIPAAAKMRLRHGLDSYSIFGVTHTTASHGVSELVADCVTGPVMPWDALICTSRSVKNTIEKIFAAESEYLQWKLGATKVQQLCATPVIPLGIHCSDHEYSEEDKETGRKAFGIEDNEIVFLYLGRLNTYMKAHAFPMYAGLQRVAEQSGKKVTLIECGWFATPPIEETMLEARESIAPDIRYLHIDGRDPVLKHQCLAGSDVFVSLSDNIQETFGLTPAEAMASGLPIIITDWDGYSELCQDGVEGFKIPTAMPSNMDNLAEIYEASGNYQRYCIAASYQTDVSIKQFTEKALLLANSPELRKELGQNGKRRAKSVYDWSVVFPQYKSLWKEMSEIRTRAKTQDEHSRLINSAPRNSPRRLDPATLFSSYPSERFTKDSRLYINDEPAPMAFEALTQLKMSKLVPELIPTPKTAELLLRLVSEQPGMQINQLLLHLNCSMYEAFGVVGVLQKFGYLTTKN